MDAKKFLLTFGVWAAAGILIFLGLRFLLPCLLPFLFGGAVAAFLRPAARELQRVTHMGPKPSAVAAALLFYGIFGIFLWSLGALLFSQAWALCVRFPQFYQSTLEPMMFTANTRISSFLAGFSPVVSRQAESIAIHLGETARDTLSALSTRFLAAAAGWAKVFPSAALAVSFAVLSSFFILMDYDAISLFISRCLPAPLFRPVRDSRRFLASTGKKVLKAYFFLIVLTFLEVAAGLWLLRVEYFAVMGLVVAVMDALPILGSGIILVPWGLFLLAGENYPLGTGILILYGVVTVVRSILEPKLIGDRIGLHPLATLLAMYAGMKLAGFWGLLLAPLLVTLLVYLHRREPLFSHSRQKTDGPEPNTPR